MTRKQPAQKKKRSSSSTQQPGLAGQKKAWSRSDKIAVIGVAVAIIGILLSLTIPEVRQFIGLDRPPKVSKQQLYPHLWEYYLGDEQILPGTKFTPLTLLYILGNSSGQSGRGVEGHLDLTSSNQTSCNFTGSMSSPDSPSIPITFSCGYSGNSVEIFKGDVYADAHIGGSVTNPADQYFAANWHFYLPNSPYVKDIPTPDVTGTPTSDVPANTNQHYQLHDQQVPICNTGNCPNYILTPLP